MRRRLLKANDSGIVLILVLWVLVILSILAFIIGWGARTEMAYAKYRVSKVKTRCYVFSGLAFAADQLRKEMPDGFTSAIYADSSGNSFRLALAPRVDLDTGYFKAGIRERTRDGMEYFQGFGDESARINLNGLTRDNYSVLLQLLLTLGFDDNTSTAVAAAIVDWKDPDNDLILKDLGAEDEAYMQQSRPYHCKNMPFDSLEELFLVKGMTSEIYHALKPYVTVYPSYDELHINFRTAPEIVLRAMARSVSGHQTNTDLADADSLVRKILEYRDSPRNKEPGKGQEIDFNEMKLNAKERALFLTLNIARINRPRVVRFNIIGAEPAVAVKTEVEVVADLQTSAILSWQAIE